MHCLLGCAGVHVHQSCAQCRDLGICYEIGLGNKDLVCKANLALRFLVLAELLLTMLGIVIGIVRALSDAWIGAQWQPAVLFGILIVILVFRPSGLLGAHTREKV